MPPEDELDPQGLPLEAAPEGQPTPPAGAGPEPEFVEIRNRGLEYEAKVDRTDFEAFADRLGLDTEKLKQALQIGLDGTRLYEEVNDERDRLRQIAAELDRARSAGTQPATPQGPVQPVRQQRYTQRPEDVEGSVMWLAEQFESLRPTLERVSTIEQILGDIKNRTEQSEELRETAEERASALKAYNEVAENWTKQGWKIPAQRELERELRRFPISDDVDLTWHDIWDRVAWMVSGPSIVRNSRRQAVLDTQKNKGGTISIPGNSGAPTNRVPVSNGADDDASLEAEAAHLQSALQGQNLMGVFGDRRTLR